ncbi:MAG TPA: CBS domain-containing protein [Blastocatellia bacterium]|nr:CBS domain-containing protein [Blastocatellia bacterium]
MIGLLARYGSEEIRGHGIMTVPDAGSRDLMVAWPDEPLREALTRMLRIDLGRLPVVSRDDPRRPIGYPGRASVMAACLRRLEEEHTREQGLQVSSLTRAQ